jgi:hypothetical protein
MGDDVKLPDKWATLRPEQIKPAQFLELTLDIYGARGSPVSARVLNKEQAKDIAKAQAKVDARLESQAKKAARETRREEKEQAEAKARASGRKAPFDALSRVRNARAAKSEAEGRQEVLVIDENKELPAGTSLMALLRHRHAKQLETGITGGVGVDAFEDDTADERVALKRAAKVASVATAAPTVAVTTVSTGDADHAATPAEILVATENSNKKTKDVWRRAFTFTSRVDSLN